MTAFYDEQPLSALYISVVGIAEIRFGIELQQEVNRSTLYRAVMV
jgi:hypothetical protein